ncbi:MULTISPECIES: hypothetical protein [unclassified Roseovarius]|jgi:hypothetical protein|nr:MULTISPECIES: hypothetical protein [unclassified Roseovarius]
MADIAHQVVSTLGVAGLAALWGLKALLGFATLRVMKRRKLRVRG